MWFDHVGAHCRFYSEQIYEEEDLTSDAILRANALEAHGRIEKCNMLMDGKDVKHGIKPLLWSTLTLQKTRRIPLESAKKVIRKSC